MTRHSFDAFRAGRWLAEDRGAFADDPPSVMAERPAVREAGPDPDIRPLPTFPLPWLIRAADDYTQRWLLEHRVRPT